MKLKKHYKYFNNTVDYVFSKITGTIIIFILIASCNKNIIIKGIDINKTENGKKNGLWFSYNDSTKIMTFENFSNDSLHGPYYQYNSDGELIVKGHYYYGKKHRKWEFKSGHFKYRKGKFIKGTIYNEANF